MQIGGARLQTKASRTKRDDLFAAMLPLEAKKALFAFVAGVREKRRAQGHDEVGLMFVDVKKVHLNAKCDEEEMGRVAG